jgi:hypothetical protein
MSAFFFLSDIYKENSSTMDETKVDIDLINGTPVCKIEGDEFLPVQGMTFVQQIEQFFNKQERTQWYGCCANTSWRG